MAGRKKHPERFRFGWARKRTYGQSPTLYVGKLPGRKSVALYTMDGGELSVHAYFRSEKDAEVVYDLLEELIGQGVR